MSAKRRIKTRISDLSKKLARQTKGSNGYESTQTLLKKRAEDRKKVGQVLRTGAL